jgi:hypothetical protein
MEKKIWYVLYWMMPERMLELRPISGDIVYFSVLGQQVIILNSLKVVNELFDKRSHMYSDRPLLPMRDMYVIPSISNVRSLIISRAVWVGNSFLG